MITPPNPGFQASALATVRRFTWVPVEEDIGELRGGWLALGSAADGRALWCAGEGPAPAGITPRYVAKDAFTAMRDGAVTQDGGLSWQGRHYTLADVGEGARSVARLVAESSAA